MTWLLIIGGLWILGKILESIESGSAQRYTLAGSSQRISSEALGYIDKYLAAIDAVCVNNRVGFALGFIQTCVALQMAKADGVITVDELKTIKTSIFEAYGNLLGEKDLEKAYELNKEHLGNLSQSEISALAGALVVHLCNIVMENFNDEEARDQLVVHILTLPYEVALADGRVTHEEERLFHAICDAAGIDQDTRISIARLAEFNAQQRSNFEKHIDNKIRNLREALQLFGLKHGFTDEDFKEAWRTFAKLNHPDRFHNVDPIMHAQVTERFQKGSAARDLIEANLSEIRADPEKYFDSFEANSNKASPPRSSTNTAPPEQAEERANSTPNSDRAGEPDPMPQSRRQAVAGVEILAKIKGFFSARFNAIRRLDGKYILTFIQNHRLKFTGGVLALLVIIGGILAYPEIRFHRNFEKLVSAEPAIHEEGVAFFRNTNEYDDRLRKNLKTESDSLKALSVIELLQTKQILIDDETWTIVRERFESHIRTSGKDALQISPECSPLYRASA
jgi:tellurite resistance protein